MATKKYLSLSKLTEYDTAIKGYIDSGDAASLANLTNGTTTVKNAEEATHAVSADSADEAAHADTADEATHATSADTATSATTATTATNASYATSAGSASSATTASKLAASKKISLSGDATGYTNFDGSSDVTISVTVADDSHNHIISNVDGLQTALDGKASSSHNHDSAYYAKSSGDSLAATVADIKDDVDTFFADATFSTAAKDTLKEIQDYIDSDVTAAANLTAAIAGKADEDHTHEIADVTGLQTALNGKAASSHGTHVTYSTTAPVMDGTASVGSASTVARSDHKHPTDTSRASQSDLDALESVVAGKSDSGHTHSDATTSAAGFMTAAMVTKLNGIAAGATKVTVDSALSSTSTNPVQNKVLNSALANYATTSALASTTSIANDAKSAAATNTSSIAANTSSINAHTTRITALETSVAEFEEITSAEIQELFA